jgi:hypothetical protein
MVCTLGSPQGTVRVFGVGGCARGKVLPLQLPNMVPPTKGPWATWDGYSGSRAVLAETRGVVMRGC